MINACHLVQEIASPLDHLLVLKITDKFSYIQRPYLVISLLLCSKFKSRKWQPHMPISIYIVILLLLFDSLNWKVNTSDLGAEEAHHRDDEHLPHMSFLHNSSKVDEMPFLTMVVDLTLLVFFQLFFQGWYFFIEDW